MKNLDAFFKPKTVAVIGASRNPKKIGFTVFKNFVEEFKGKTFPVNPNAEKVLGRKAYASVKDIRQNIDLAVIVIPAEKVPHALKECVEKKVKAVVIISSGFSEIGNEKLEEELRQIIKGSDTRVIGPNCLGVFDSRTRVNSLFLPKEKLQTPRRGGIAFISQSGAVGSVVVDWMAHKGYGLSKFISYGNAVDVNETDLIEYLAEDKETKVICVYLEGVKNGKRFMNAVKKTVKKKPVIVLKGGRTSEGAKAVASHTGSLAGNDKVYDAAFKQSGAIRAKHMIEMFNFARAMVDQPLPQGDRILIVTNGGGFGVLATDQAILKKLKLAELSRTSKQKLKKILPSYAEVKNPLDLVGDADDERYRKALEIIGKDKNVDAVLLILLFQTAPITPKVVDYVIKFSKKKKKPVIVCSAGGEYSEKLIKKLEENDIPVFDCPARAVDALDALVDYSNIRKGKEWTYE